MGLSSRPRYQVLIRSKSLTYLDVMQDLPRETDKTERQ